MTTTTSRRPDLRREPQPNHQYVRVRPRAPSKTWRTISVLTWLLSEKLSVLYRQRATARSLSQRP